MPLAQSGWPVQTTAVSLALGITMEGEKARLGLWLRARKGAQCWHAVCTELKNRGVTEAVLPVSMGAKGCQRRARRSFRNRRCNGVSATR